MVSFGIDAIRYFNNARNAGVSKASDLSYTFNRANGFDSKLRSAGHTKSFYWANTDCWETDIRDSDQGGDDSTYVDTVDLFWIETHGNHTSDGQVFLRFDTPQTTWRTKSGEWQLGEGWNAEWIMAFACKTVDRNNVGGLWNIFAGLHMFCGSWDNMYDGSTTDECGEDVADNLIHGHTVSESWHDGVSDWKVDNHPITVAVDTTDTWNNGNVRWDRSFFNRDHLPGHGSTMADLPPGQQGCILIVWTEG
jgi:Family of unknown function (DUF6345)